MALFKNPHESHEHSLKVLNSLREYDTFLESLTVIADMGAGSGLDAEWFAKLTTRDENPEPLNYIVYAVDQNIKQLEIDTTIVNNVIPMEGNFENRVIPRQVDLIWAHDSFQYAFDPFKTLAEWKKTMSVNGMLVLSIPQTTYWDNRTGKLVVSNHSGQYYSYNVLNLMYMLAISGFDTRDAFFYRDPDSPWLYAAVYASENGPLDKHATWYDLAERYLINDSVMASVNKYGYARLEDVVVRWFDKNYYQINN
jgi:SAM-dependent methyltransferase